MIPMFPFSINNTAKFLANNCSNNPVDPVDEYVVKERVNQAVLQSLPTKKTIKVNAILVLECDGDQKRTIVINETINGNMANNVNNSQKMQFTFPTTSFATLSTSDTSNPTSVLLSQQPVFPATIEGLQALLNLTSSSMTRANMVDGVVHNNYSFVPQNTETLESSVKVERTAENECGGNSRKRKADKPCRIPQDLQSELNGLDLTLGGKCEDEMRVEKHYQSNSIPIWPCPVSIENRTFISSQPIILPRPKKTAQLPGHKKSSKVFNCNQCKLQFNSLNALCKHTFSDHRAFRCTFCSANFTQRSNLQRHSLKHVGFKPFICNVCSKAYYRKDHLVRHIEVSHPGSEPKSNITVKLSSSECLEYLERMQSNKLMEDENRFLNVAATSSPTDSTEVNQMTLPPNHNGTMNVHVNESPERLQISLNDVVSIKEPCHGDGMTEYSCLDADRYLYDQVKGTSIDNNDTESPERLQISLDDVNSIKGEYHSDGVTEYSCQLADGLI